MIFPGGLYEGFVVSFRRHFGLSAVEADAASRHVQLFSARAAN